MRRNPLLCLLILLVGTGCGGPKLYPVQGTVYWTDGKPALELVGGTVNFVPLDGKSGAMGEIGAEARYRLGSKKASDGVLEGEYHVVFSPPPTGDPDKPTGKSVLKEEYQRLELKPLRVKVEARDNDIPLKLERAGR